MIYISLPSNWELGTVRAVLALLINVFCVAGVWVVAYCSWKSSALKVPSHKASTSLLSLFFPSGIGDVVDIIPMLRRGLARSLLWRLVSQGVLITVLTAVAIASAPLAASSTRLGSEIRNQPISILRARNNFTGITSTMIEWNKTIDRFNSAQVPLDQLLDVLPDIRVDWHYDPAEWKSTWSAKCEYTNRTEIELFSTGNETGYLFEEMEGIDKVFPAKYSREGNSSDYLGWQSPGSWANETWRDVLLWVVMQNDTRLAYNQSANRRDNYLPLDFSMSVFHLHNFPVNHTSGRPKWGRGKVEKAAFTRMDCHLERVPGRQRGELTDEEELFIAYPWTADVNSIALGYANFWEPRQSLATFNNRELVLPTGPEMFRFLQAYHITKDTMFNRPDSMTISVNTPTVQLASPTLAVLLLYIVALAVATVYFVFFKKLPAGTSIPRTKVQWMMQGIKEVGGRDVNAGYLEATWGQLEGDLAKARYADVNDTAGRSYRTIQLGRSETDLELLPMRDDTAYMGASKSMTL